MKFTLAIESFDWNTTIHHHWVLLILYRKQKRQNWIQKYPKAWKTVLLNSFLPHTFWEHHACLIHYAQVILKLGNMLPAVFGKWMCFLMLIHWPFFHTYAPSQENAWAILRSQKKQPADEVTDREKILWKSLFWELGNLQHARPMQVTSTYVALPW